MVCGPSGPNLMTHLATASLGMSQCRLAIPNKNVTKPHLESFKGTSFNVFQIVPQHFCQKWDLLNHNYSTDSTSINHNFPHLHPLQAEPPQAATPADRDSPRLCNGAFHLQKNCQIPDGAQGVRMHRAELIFSPTQGPAMELLRLQGGLWMGDSRVAPHAVARWALCCDPQLVKGNVLLVMQCGTLIVQTPKPANLRMRKWESDLHRMGWWEPRSQGEGFSCTALSWHTLSMHQPKL